MAASPDYMNTTLNPFPEPDIRLTCIVPGSFLDKVQQTIDRYVPRSRFTPSLGSTGTRESLNAMYEDQAIAMGAADRVVKLHYASPEHWLAKWKLTCPPLKRAYQLIDPEWRNQFSDDLLELAKQFTGVDATGRFIQCDYLEFLVHKSLQQ